ncbi:hypothetical protein EI94DRAFT_1794404 [Lactarius quietus]|nr:hypothetical protein EI94DRAFT_1794404 [Lactarius quietus]
MHVGFYNDIEFALLLQEGANSDSLTSKAVKAVADRVEERLEAVIEETMNKMSGMVESLSANQKEFQTSTTALSEMVETYRKLMLDMSDHVKATMEMSNQLTNMVSLLGNPIAKLTDAGSQLATTTSTYKDVLIRNGEQPLQSLWSINSSLPQQQWGPGSNPMVDPKIIRDIERKAKQVLINMLDPKIAGASQTEIKEKVSVAINVITDPPPPADITNLEVIKLHKGGFTIHFKEQETVE